MCDTMEVSYDDGDIVWVKLGSCWWPGEVWALDKLPNDMTKSFRKTPIAVVKFFEEDSFEYVKNTNLIYKYNCNRKNEFIKKGMDLHRGKLSHMEKFPSDVVQAERLTHGDEDILDCLEFSAAEVRKPSYAGIFGSPAKTPSHHTPVKKGRFAGSAKRKSDLNQPKITHPRIIQKFLKGCSDYKAHILVQEPKRDGTPVTPDSSKLSRSESNASPSVSESSPRTPSGNCAATPGTYACHACNFTATRLNVMILHNKSHSAGFIPYTPPKKHKIKTSPLKLKTVKLESPSGISSLGNNEKKSRKKPKTVIQSSGELDAEVSLPSIKRKGGKGKEKDVKKPKTDIEIKNSLLADWSEDSDESMDILSSLKLTENQTAPDTEKLQESDDLSPEPLETEEQKDKDPEPEAGSIKMADEMDARKHASCFDFDDDDDTELPIESLGRKIPRVVAKSDDLSKRSVDVDCNDDTYDKLEGKASKTADEEAERADSSDINEEIANLLQETVVPELPSLPSDLKLGENFQKGKAIKFPDKEKESTERLPIFKTKTFFRSRHSRSQDAIEKYVADNVGADKRPTYMEETHTGPVPADSFALCESDSEHVSIETPSVVAEQPILADIKTAKLTPKIMLKKMKITVIPKKEPTHQITETVSLKENIVEDTKTVIENSPCHVQDDKWSNENLEKLLETDSFGDEKKTESYSATDDLLGTIEEVQSEIFHNSEDVTNHVDLQKDEKIIVSDVIVAKETPILIDGIVDMPAKVDNVPTESDLQIAEALINLPARAGPLPLLIAIDQNPPCELSEHAVLENPIQFTESDPSFNAAESLVRMSEAFATEPVQSQDIPNTVLENVAEPPVALPSDILESSPVSIALSAETSGTNLFSVPSDGIENNFLPDSSKLPMIETDKVETPSKVVLSKIASPKGREKILNFNVSGGLPPKAQKQKVIIRRTAVPKIHRSGGDRFGDTSHEKLVLSNKTVGGRDGDVQTFTIERPASDDQEPSLSTRTDKAKKFFPGKQKLIIKPHGAIITSTGKILQTVEPKVPKKDEDVLFDINSMPIVLSEEILSTETMGTPVASRDVATVSKVPDAIPEIKKVEVETVTKKVSPIKKYNAEPLVTKPSNFVLKTVIEKSASPNILSKSKIKSYKNLILMDKQPAVDQKFTKQNEVKESIQGKVTKNSSPSTLKTEKYIIVPSSGSKMAPGDQRTQKIILNPQTGKGQVLLGRVNDSAQTENFPAGKSQKTLAKIIQNRSSQSTGNAIMILTNAQGVQSKIVLSSEHQRLLFPKKSIQTTAITPQSVVTSKGTILSPIAVNRNKNVNVTSHSIIAPQSQIINPGLGSGFMSSGRQIAPPRLVAKKNLPTPPKTQLIMTGNPNTRTILTGRPGQTILTSKGQLITQSSIVTSQSKISNIVKTTTVLSQPGRQLKLVKTAPPPKPQIKTKQGSLSQIANTTSSMSGMGEPTTLLLKSSPGKGQTFIRGPGERPLVIPQRGGVLQLTVAQFEHMQKTGRLVHKAVAQKSAVQSRSIIDTSPKSQNPKFIIQKYSNSKRTAEQAGIKPKGISTYSANVPPLALIQTEPPVKRQKLRELLSVKPEINNSGMHGVPLIRSSEPKAPIEQMKSRVSTMVQQIAPAPAALNRTTEMDSYQKTAKTLPSLENFPSIESEPSAEALKATAEAANADRLAAPPAESQLLAVPGENFGGPPDSFFLCVEENGTLTPVNNQPLVLENNQLVPMVIEPPPPLRIEETAVPIPSNAVALEEASEGQAPGIILNTGDQQILLDRQTLMGLLSGEGQQLVTADGQRLILQGDVQQLISALAGNPEIASLLSGGQQILLDGGDAAHPMVVPADQSGLPSSIGNDYLFPRGVQASANQDILAAALAGTDVFQQDPLIHDSLNIATGVADGLGEIDSLSSDFQNFNASVSVHSNVSETSSTLHQPIMSPLEVPSKKRTGRQMDGGKGSILLPPKNLEDSLAGIGVTAPSIPTSLDLPITVTDPRIASKVSVNPLSLSCGVVYQSSGILNNSMLSPGVRMSDVDSSQGRLDYAYDGYGLSADPVDKISVSLIRKGDYSSKKPTPKFVSDPILSSQREKARKGETIAAAPSMPVLSSSMPRLDDSSSDGFPDDHPQPPPDTVQAKTYSPISMPLLTEDTADELPPGDSASPIETSAACDVPRETFPESFVSHAQDTYTYSEAKSEPALIESATTAEMKALEIETDTLDLQTHDPQNEPVELNSIEGNEEINMTVEDIPVVSSDAADSQVSESGPFHCDTDTMKEHDISENSIVELPSFLETQHNPDVLNNQEASEVEVDSFPDDETVSEINNKPENFNDHEDVALHHSNMADDAQPEDFTVSDACDSNLVENNLEVHCLPVLHDTPCEQSSVISEPPKIVEEPENNAIESSFVEDESVDPQSNAESLQHNDDMQYSTSTKLHETNIVEFENDITETHCNINEHKSDKTESQCHISEPESSVDYSHIAEPGDILTDPENIVKSESGEQYNDVVLDQEDGLSESQSNNMEIDNRTELEVDNNIRIDENISEREHLESMEIVTDRISPVNDILEPLQPMQCEKSNEDIEMTDASAYQSETPVITSDNGEGTNSNHDISVDHSLTLNNEEHTNDNFKLDSDVIEPSSVPSETCESPDRPITPYRLVRTPNDETCLADAPCDPSQSLHVPCEADQLPEQAPPSPNLNTAPSTPELLHNYSDSSSDDSVEIPIQPSISVSHHLVQTMMCTADRPTDNTEKKSPEDCVQPSDNSFTFDDER